MLLMRLQRATGMSSTGSSSSSHGGSVLAVVPAVRRWVGSSRRLQGPMQRTVLGTLGPRLLRIRTPLA